jgi:hypothetical protein
MAESVKEIRALFQGTHPTNSWDAILRQLLFWSARRFCVDRLSGSSSTKVAEPLDLSGAVPAEPSQLWDTHFDLMEEFAPPAFFPYLREWLSPEHFQSLSKSYEIDIALRNLVRALDESVFSESDEEQEEISSLLDDELPLLFESWLGISFAPLLFFPTAEDSDEDISPSKLHSILLLMKVYKPEIRKRKTMRNLNVTVRAQIRKTRRNKQKHETPKSVSVPLSSNKDGDGARGSEGEGDGSGSEKREGGEESHAKEEWKDEHQHDKTHEEGSQEYSSGEVHA